jgi:hypothetical protein
METIVIYLNIDSEGNIDHCIVNLNCLNSEEYKELERTYEYSYVNAGFGLYHWCKRAERLHFAVSSKQIPDALRAFVMLMEEVL